jgi:hypothetical protein
MSLFRGALKGTYTAFVVGFVRHQHGWCRPLMTKVENLGVHQKLPPVSNTIRRLSAFQAPEPPQSKGQAVYNDIDFNIGSESSSQSTLRNSDTDAVFVVSGASRGIGLQFVKSLIERTKVSIRSSPDACRQL